MKRFSLYKPANKKHTRQPLIERLFAFLLFFFLNRVYLTLLNSFSGDFFICNLLHEMDINLRLNAGYAIFVNQLPFKPYLAA